MLPPQLIQAIEEGDEDALKDLLTLIEVRGVPLDNSPIVTVRQWELREEYQKTWAEFLQKKHKLPLNLIEAFFEGDQEAREDLATLVGNNLAEDIASKAITCEATMSLDEYILRVFFSETTTKEQKKLIWGAREYVILDHEIPDEYFPGGRDETGFWEPAYCSYKHERKTIAEIIGGYSARLKYMLD